MQIRSPIPEEHRDAAALLWWQSFGTGLRRRTPPEIRPAHGIAAIDRQGTLAGVMGLRDDQGGFLVARPSIIGLLYRPAPPTSDLVVDGIVSARPRQGAGRAMMTEGLDRARAAGRPGLRVEVQASNRTAIAFYASLGFVEIARGGYGWPWTGPVMVMRRAA
ncbi:GNAT family N-acetyltransferase [Paracoccus caeni]|uniref:GNAT family N-acetyltransferase n=1 Tax=Paracoccus caeni TaxID=657651 RepID=A0A934W0P1_9RHOB|nr:GNAT family N-acetyltransferase [Paracoccus caeni]MBK4216543.1 GNAT family N-acetyltransferase [Paracoccus caeni]